MPQQTVYIRNNDMHLWKAIGNKAEFIAMALRSKDLVEKAKLADISNDEVQYEPIE